MAKPTNKQELIAAMQMGYEKLNEQINKLDPAAAAPHSALLPTPRNAVCDGCMTAVCATYWHTSMNGKC